MDVNDIKLNKSDILVLRKFDVIDCLCYWFIKILINNYLLY